MLETLELPNLTNHHELFEIGEIPYFENIEATNEDEQVNLDAVRRSMTTLMRTPTIQKGAIMPDACPAGPEGTIPVGGIVATKNAIHPGFHSADICCSLMMTDLGDVDPKTALDCAHKATHFGVGGRYGDNQFQEPVELIEQFRENSFLNKPKILTTAHTHMGTQGDGNHFLFVGRSRSTGRVVMVTHHGSRGPGALLYREGMIVAEDYRRKLSPKTMKQNAWIPADTQDGKDYWQALQIIRTWTKMNHEILHQTVCEALGIEAQNRFWNEHNFVFKRDDLYYHGKGATPAWDNFSEDSSSHTLIPLNMAEPILVVRGNDAENGLGFSPHGAGRNFSRSEHKRRHGNYTPEQLFAKETEGLDVRFFSGQVDISELPSSYKNADNVVKQIKNYGLAEIEDYIDPFGCIMAGYIKPFWLKDKKS